ncbi:MAG: ABC transporter ATP-binding protein [Bacteroidales bacterium]|nr:ABC transporter ATP-binding protein [Bacteroidales bacterium]
MKEKLALFRKSLGLVWESAPGWTTVNIFLSILRSFLPLALIYLIKLLTDEITGLVMSGQDFSLQPLAWLIASVVTIYLLDEASADAGSYAGKKQSMNLEAYMLRLLHEKAVKLDLINFEHPGYFDCLARATREAPWRPYSILNNLISILRASVSLILMAGLLFSLHWSMALLLMAVNIPGIWLRLHYANILYNFQKEQTPEARKSAYFNWLLTGDRPSRELRLFSLGKYFISLFRNSYLKQKEEEIEIVRKRTVIALLTDLVKAGAILLMLLFITKKTITREVSLGQMAMFLLAFRQGMIYIKDLFASLAGLYEDGLFIGDTFEFLNLKEQIKPEPPVTEADTKHEKITVENITFSYPGSKVPAIKNVSFEINRGEIIALAGPNGAGKSTLVKLLTRLYDPDSGQIKLNGKDIRHFDPEAYRKLYSVIFQDFMLYNLTAGENIRLGDIDKPPDKNRIRESASLAGLDELISSLPDGYDTLIGNLFDNSRELSWGEWQKIALARALFRDAPLIILDEPVSALDADTEYEIFSRFREILKGRTAIVISHRLTNISLADRIIVLDRGAVAESGTHQELMDKGGLYSKMYFKQTGRFEKYKS